MNGEFGGSPIDRQTATAAAAVSAPLRALLIGMDTTRAGVDALSGICEVASALNFASGAKTLEMIRQTGQGVDVVIADPWSIPAEDGPVHIAHWHRLYPAVSFILMGQCEAEQVRRMSDRVGRTTRVLFLAQPFEAIELRQLARLIRTQSRREPAPNPVVPPGSVVAANVARASEEGTSGAQSRWAFERALDRALKDESTGHTLCIFAVDRFHPLLDRLGAAAQASILRRIRSCIADTIRLGDRVADLGEQEFGVLLSGTNAEQGAVIAESVLLKLRELAVKWRDVDLRLTLSAGVTDTTQQERKSADIMSAADTALQAARSAGGDKVRVYRKVDSDLVKRREQSNSLPEIEAALTAGRMRLYAQLIVPLADDEVIHAELLLRMIDTHGQLWSPARFLPVAERFGIAPRFDRWVFDRTLSLLNEWGHDVPHLGHVSVNLSGQTLMDGATLDWIESRYRAAAIKPGAICFEITETAAIDSWSTASSFIERLRDHGALFSLDDFGAGFSSFSYLESVPTDFLKIDGSFVRQCLTDPRQMELVRALNQIGHLFGKKTVAEFVENDQLLAAIRGMGVDCAQGYFTGQPFPAEDLLEVIAAWRARHA